MNTAAAAKYAKSTAPRIQISKINRPITNLNLIKKREKIAPTKQIATIPPANPLKKLRKI